MFDSRRLHDDGGDCVDGKLFISRNIKIFGSTKRDFCLHLLSPLTRFATLVTFLLHIVFKLNILMSYATAEYSPFLSPT